MGKLFGRAKVEPVEVKSSTSFEMRFLESREHGRMNQGSLNHHEISICKLVSEFESAACQ